MRNYCIGDAAHWWWLRRSPLKGGFPPLKRFEYPEKRYINVMSYYYDYINFLGVSFKRLVLCNTVIFTVLMNIYHIRGDSRVSGYPGLSPKIQDLLLLHIDDWPVYMKFIIKCICQSEVRASVGGS